MQTTEPRHDESPNDPAAFGPVERHLRSRYEAALAHGPFVPLLLGLLALLLWFGLQTWLLTEERSTLATTHAAQQQTVDNAAKLRASLDALAADTQRLADAGNPNARLLVDELRKRGITINPNPPAAPAETKK